MTNGFLPWAWWTWAATLGATAAGGCVSTADPRASPAPTVRAGEFGRQDCFLRRQVEDFEVLNDGNLLVYVPDRRTAYHVRVSPPAQELRFAQSLGFESRHSTVCGYAGDRLLLDAAGGVQRHSITGVYRIDETAVTTLRSRFGLVPRPTPPAPVAPEPGGVQRDLGTQPQAP